MEYTLIRSSRKTIAIQIKNGEIIVRAPLRAKIAEIESFLKSSSDWIEKTLAKSAGLQAEKDGVEKLTTEELRELANKALKIIPERAAHYAPLIGVGYGRITIRNQRTKWGSCSGKGNLNFNVLLMLAPPEVLDSVVVHELCHRKEMNHSPRFYDEVLRVFPDYKKWDKWLKDNGALLMARMPE